MLAATKLPAMIAMADPPARKRPRNYRKFDPDTKKRWRALVESPSASYEARVIENGGKLQSSKMK